MKKKILYSVIILSVIAIVRWIVVLWKKATSTPVLAANLGQKFSAVVNPMVMRNDVRGSGEYKATRIGHTHEGIDVICYEGYPVYAPFSGKITREAYPYAGSTRWRGLVLEGDNGFTMKLFYVSLIKNIGESVVAGQQIAIAQGISKKYGVGMKDHVHIELLKANQNIDPTPYFI